MLVPAALIARLDLVARRLAHMPRLAATCLAATLSIGVQAATFNVNSPADIADANPGDGVCETAPGNKICTLRAAVQEANALKGTDTINLQGITYTLTLVGVEDLAAAGDLDILESVNIVGTGSASTIIDGNGALTGDRVFQIAACASGSTFTCDVDHPPVTVAMSGLTIKNGFSTNFAGGILNDGTLMLDHVVVTANQVNGINDWGGGILNFGALTLTNSVVSNNSTGSSNPYGGGIFNQGPLTIANSTVSGNTTPSQGGGIYTTGLVGDSTRIVGSTISGNQAANGGGIYNPGTHLVLINSTVSGNFSAGDGGGIYVVNGTTGLFNVTVTQNQANSDGTGFAYGGGVYAAAAATFNFINSIISQNQLVIPTLPFPTLDVDDCYGTINSQGYNIVTDVNASYCTVAGGASSAAPGLGPLQFNGGPTRTHALLIGSPAIDAGNPGGCTDDVGAPLTTDQRGIARPTGLHCDIGAFEYADEIFKNGFQP